MAALFEQLGRGVATWADPRIPDLLAWLRAGQRRSELHALLRASSDSLPTLTLAHASELVALLRDFDLSKLAYAVSALPQLAADPALAFVRARLAMQLHDYAAAIAASDLAIAALLQPGLSIEEFLQRCAAGAAAEGMLRFERHVLADRAHLSERLALRWEALHRSGQSRDASLMQLMCQRYFPERASVWATAGNHALDADDLSAAEGYFQRCLQLDAHWTAGLAGLAIVHERRKDWAAALPYRRRVLDVERALEHDDAASLQRMLRYAAALARLGRWLEAEPLFRRAARASALSQLPAEQPVLLRVFSQDLYAPAIVCALLLGGAAAPSEHAEHPQPFVRGPLEAPRRSDLQEPAVTLAQHEAGLFEQLQAAASNAPEPRWALALCAYLSGELERAYELLDQVELDRPNDLAVHYLLWRCASATGQPEAESIRVFAQDAARALAQRPQPSVEQLSYATAILPELGQPASVHEELEPVDAPWLVQLERLAMFRAVQHAAGCSPLAAAAASTEALAALVASVLGSVGRD